MMDKGLRIGRWGQLQGQLSLQSSFWLLLDDLPIIEWKVDMDRPTDTHRHLSHLIGVRFFIYSASSSLNHIHSYIQDML